jgi:hypothetical protein
MNTRWNKQHKPGAYTIVEVLIVLVISGIVIATAVSAFISVQNLFAGTYRQNQSNDKLGMLYYVLNMDISESKRLTYSFVRLHAHKKFEPDIYYYLNDKNVIRETGYTKDTFMFSIRDVHSNYIKNGAYIIDTIKFTIYDHQTPYTWQFTKHYGTAMYFNINNEE